MSDETSSVRKIIHMDMDAFYASVEQRDRPELRGKPVIVGGDPTRRGVVAAASYEARKFGVHSAMSGAKALRLCPHAIFVKPDFARYKEASRQIQALFQSVTPLVEPLSLDEAYLDVTENALNQPLAQEIAKYLKQRIFEETGLTASAGVAPNKFVAKIASDFKKPNGLVVVPPPRVLKFLERLPVEKIWGVGPATAARLHALGLYTCADIRARRVADLAEQLGKYGPFLHALASGVDVRQVEADHEAKSRGSETTFDVDILNPQQLLEILRDQADEVARDLQKIDRTGRTVHLKLRYADFTTITRSHTLLRPSADAQLIFEKARQLLLTKTQAGLRPTRLIGVSMSGLSAPNEPGQLWLDFPVE